MAELLRVVIADDNYLVREGTRRLLEDSGEVTDDGCGFDATAARGLGLTGLADRMAIVHGTLLVDSRPGHGTTLRAEIPLPDLSESGRTETGQVKDQAGAEAVAGRG